jgi:hypothetical protein
VSANRGALPRLRGRRGRHLERCLACEAEAIGTVERCPACEADAVGTLERAFPKPRDEANPRPVPR